MEQDDERKASTDGSDVNRQQGIELAALDDELEAHDYPATSTELVSKYGDYEILLPGGSQRFEEILGLLDGNSEEFENAEDVRRTILNLVGTEAVGRANYSDRGGSTPDDGLDTDDVSF